MSTQGLSTSAARRIVRAMERGSFRLTIGPDAKILDVLMRLNIKRAILLVTWQTKALLSDGSPADAT